MQVTAVADEKAVEGLKFSACLPTDMALEMSGKRFTTFTERANHE